MNDDAHSPELELASAYLDGDVDEVQRAQVESSPELMALLASFGQVKAGLRDTPPVDADARDTAVLAALAEFDVLRAPPVAAVAASTAATGNVVPLQRRARFSRVVMSAAAALLIGGVGVVAVKSFGGSSNDQSSSADPAAAKELAADTADSSAGDAAGGAPPQTIGAINGAASAVPALDDPQDLMAFAAAPAPTSLESDTETTAFAATETTAAGALETVAGPDVATETIADASPPPASRAVVPSFEFDCPLEPTQVVVVEITWKGTPAVAVRDTVSGVIQAIDAQCTVLATVEP
jgi:hypothetical protein